MVLPLLAAIIPVAAKAIGGLFKGSGTAQADNSNQQTQQPQARQKNDQVLACLLNGQISPQQARAIMGMS